MFKALVERLTKSQALKAAGQGHTFQALVEPETKSQTLKTLW
jgi:hypothetical protein